MEMHDRPALRTVFVHCQMEEIFLARFGAGDEVPVPVEFGEGRGIELAQAGICGRQQPAIRETNTDIATAPGA